MQKVKTKEKQQKRNVLNCVSQTSSTYQIHILSMQLFTLTAERIYNRDTFYSDFCLFSFLKVSITFQSEASLFSDLLLF